MLKAVFEVFSCFRKKSYCLTNSISPNNFGRILVDFELYIGLFLFRVTTFDLSDKVSGGDFGMGKFLIGVGVEEVFSVHATVVSSFFVYIKR